MSSSSRRDILKFAGAAAAGAMLGIGGWEASRRWGGGEGGHEQTANAKEQPAKPSPSREAPQTAAAPKRIIDTHVHVVRSNLPGTPALAGNEPDPRDGQLETVAKKIAAQLKGAGVEHAL